MATAPVSTKEVFRPPSGSAEPGAEGEAPQGKRPFPRVFWVALLLELLERLAFYGVYVNLAVYLTGTVGLSDVENGSLLGVFALVRSWVPVGTGVLADRIGFRRSLAISFALYVIAYGVLFLAPTRPGAWAAVMGMAIAGAFLKPVIPGTVRRYSPPERRPVGFSYFYASVNAGSVVGKVATKIVREMVSLRASMVNAIIACVIGLGLTIALFREPSEAPSPVIPPKSPEPGEAAEKVSSGAAAAEKESRESAAKKPASGSGESAAKANPANENALDALLGALKRPELMMFVLLISGYYLLIEQFYQTFPTYIVRQFGEDAPREYITLINPAAIAIFQVLVGRLTAKIPGPYAIALGVLVGAGSMLLMGAVPSLAGACGAFFIFAVAEMILSPRYYEYFSSFAPKGREGMYMGLAIVPVGIGGLIGGVLSGNLVARYLPKGGELRPLIVWGTYAAIGVGCSLLLALYGAWALGRQKRAAGEAPAA
ncbi:MAG: MFS transporter [Polyangiaceae bacterium]